MTAKSNERQKSLQRMLKSHNPQASIFRASVFVPCCVLRLPIPSTKALDSAKYTSVICTQEPMSAIEQAIPRKSGPKLTEADRRNVIACYVECGSIGKTAERFELNRTTVSNLVKSVRESRASVLSPNWRENMRPKAVTAVNAGLDHNKDPYKRANIGVQVLKGLGDFRGDQDLNIVTLVTSSPAGLDRVIEALPSVPQTLPHDPESV